LTIAALQSPEIIKKGSKSGDYMKWRKPSQPTPTAGATPLRKMLDPQHSLYRLAEAINWPVFDEQFGPLYADGVGRPALSTRLMVALHYIKHIYDLSDDLVLAGFLENPYWQFFCGMEYFQHHLPCDPTSLVKWRKRVGAEGIKQLLKETIDAAKRHQVLKKREIETVNVDTTVQEKAIAFPTDARLYHKARRALVRLSRGIGLKLRQSYSRLGKKALFRQSRYAAAQQMQRARKQTKKLRTYLGRVLRNVERFVGPVKSEQEELVRISRRIFEQKREDNHKLYSLHAPEVECISKGKAHKRYEFGCKVSIVTTSKAGWVVAIDAMAGNPYDGATLKPALKQVEELTAVKPKEAFADKGYRGSEHHPEGVEVYLSGRKKLSRRLAKMLKRRAAIEPVIGHCKQEHGLERNHLLGAVGDRINAILSGCGWNLKKLMRSLVDRLPQSAAA
jgi:transposase, IS5 family